MLKMFYKIILVSFLSGSLLLLDFSYKGISLKNAYGQQASSTLTSQNLQTGSEDKTDILATLTMTAIGTLAARLYTYKPTIDIWVAAAGGALFIAGEVLAFSSIDSKLKELNTQVIRDANGNMNQEQIDTLKRLKQSYEAAKGSAGTKKMLQMAAAAAFAGAGATAFAMSTSELTGLTTCTTAIVNGLAALPGIASSCAGTCSGEVAACSAGIGAYKAALMSAEFSRQVISPTAATYPADLAAATALQTQVTALPCLALTAPIKATVVGACAPFKALEMTQASVETVPVKAAGGYKELPAIFKKIYIGRDISSQPIIKKNFFDKALNLFFSPAEAALFSAMGIASSAAVNYLLITSATLGTQIDMFMMIPKNRMYVWATLAATTALATASTNNQIKKIDEDISKIDTILNGLGALADGATTTQPGTLTNNGTTTLAKPTSFVPNATNYSDVNVSPDGKTTLPCYTGSSAAGTCKSFSDTIKSSADYQNLNPQSQLELGNILKVADGVNGTSTISKATLSGAAQLGTSANALRASLAKSQKGLSEMLKKNGLKDDSDALNKKLNDGINKSVLAGLKGIGPSDMLAGLSGGSGKASANAGTGAVLEAKVDAAAIKKGAVPAAGVIDIGAGSSAAAMDLGLKSGVSTPSAADLAANDAAIKGAASIDSYDLKNDITKDTSSSIFELISNRYQRSGYPRLFKLKEPTDAVNK